MNSSYPKFNIPKSVHKNIWIYILYKIGLHKYSVEEELSLVGKYLGIYFDLKKVEKLSSYRPDLPRFSGHVAYNKDETVKAFGLGFGGYHLSMAKVFGEYLERFIFIDPKFPIKSVKLSIPELRNLYNIVLPIDFDANREQPKKLIDCVMATEYMTKRNVLYPKNCFFYGDQVYDKEIFLYPKNSSGAAGWYDYDGAVSRALLELVEREAYVLFLDKYLQARKIFFDVEIELVKKAQTDFAKYGLRSTFYNISSDINIPVILVLVEDMYNESNFYTVSASGNSFTMAICQAVAEMYQNLHQLEVGKNISKFDILNLLSKKEEKNYFSDLQNLYNFSLNPNEITRRISNALGEINVYICSPLNPYLKAINFTTVKVVVPEMLSYLLENSEKIQNQKRLDIFSQNMPIK